MTLPVYPWEQIVEFAGDGDGATFIFQTSFRQWPADLNSAWGFWTPTASVVDQIAAVDRDQIPSERLAKVQQYNGCAAQMSFDKIPPQGAAIYVCYRWRPAALSKAKFFAQIDGVDRWVSLDELRESLASSPTKEGS